MGNGLSGIGSFLRSFTEASPDRKAQMVQQMRELATAQAQTIQAVTAHEQLRAAEAENELARMLAPSRIALAQAQAKSMTAGAERTAFELEEMKREVQEKELAIQNMGNLLSQLAPESIRPFVSKPENIAMLLRNPQMLSALLAETAGVAAGLPGARVEKEAKEVSAAVSEAELRAQRAAALVQEREPVQAAKAGVAELRAKAEVAPLEAPRIQAGIELAKAQAQQINMLLEPTRRNLAAEAAINIAKARQLREGRGIEPLSPADLDKMDEIQARRAVVQKLVETGAFPDAARAEMFVREHGGPEALQRQITAIDRALSGTDEMKIAMFVLEQFGKTIAEATEEEKRRAREALENLAEMRKELAAIYSAIYGRAIGQAGAFERLQGAITDEEIKALEGVFR